ncbi:Asp-tRNAAsn/Glu-tRNAGln amidotransferase B subunit [Leptolyngbya sp. PCC 6406]|uniref:Asp-tRNAAsn/Glu-tRNAGln amidotransferase B subunit n=1 Tax=Leptolyngbya sp. PCC 6406 TaxID=1173264 RepID=UPI0002ACC2A1|nr:Asp-tRNAAsn/Glu-tRNAGln amidotransferase B subunit [Leptolyngbya sp. PCC 6406]
MSNDFPIIEVPTDAARAEEAMGSKRKFWYDDHTLGECLFKRARPNTGEDWSEKIAAELCQLLGLPHATYELAIWNGQWGTISPNLLPPKTTLVHGNEILAALVSSYPKHEGYNVSQHTLTLVFQAISQAGVQLPPHWQAPLGIDSAVATFIGYLLLDAWIGNGDRHHENWGFVMPLPGGTPMLAPTYDHAACLGRELQDTKRQRHLTQQTVATYAAKSRSAFYRQEVDRKPMLTFTVFATVARNYGQSAARWLEQLANITPSQITELLNRIPQHRISPTALEFARQMLDINRNRLMHLQETLP